MSEYKKFDLEAALRGEKVVVINKNSGLETQTVEVAKFPSGDVVVRLQMGTLLVFDGDGRTGCWELVMAPKPKREVKAVAEVFAAPRSPMGYMLGAPYAPGNLPFGWKKGIATVPIEFEVGDNDK